MRPAAREAHRQMVDFLIARGSLWSAPLIEAFRATPRQFFLDRVYYHSRQKGGWQEVQTASPGRGELRLIYSDRALTTRLSEPGPGQVAVPISSSSQPSLMAQILEDLGLERGQRVLEIGAGTGYNAALMAHVAGEVTTLEVDRVVLAEARRHLQAFPDRAVSLEHGDGREGDPAGAPYDRLVVTAATPDLEPAWLEQVRDGGLVVAPLALAPGLAFMLLGRVNAGSFEGRLVRPAYFMPLRCEDGSNNPDPTVGSPPLPPPENLTPFPAPWAGWTERKSYLGGPPFMQALAFLAWLEGLTVSYQSFGMERPVYGVGDMVQGYACWLGTQEWRITGKAGRDLGLRLWNTFLGAGGPWPTEFSVHAVPKSKGNPGPGAAGGQLAYGRVGPTCRQQWVLVKPRERQGWPT